MRKRKDTIAYTVGVGGVSVQIVCPQGFQEITTTHLKQIALWSLCQIVAKERAPTDITDNTA